MNALSGRGQWGRGPNIDRGGERLQTEQGVWVTKRFVLNQQIFVWRNFSSRYIFYGRINLYYHSFTTKCVRKRTLVLVPGTVHLFYRHRSGTSSFYFYNYFTLTYMFILGNKFLIFAIILGTHDRHWLMERHRTFWLIELMILLVASRVLLVIPVLLVQYKW